MSTKFNTQSIKNKIYAVSVLNKKKSRVVVEDSQLIKVPDINYLNCEKYDRDNYFILCDREDVIKREKCTKYIRFYKIKIEGVTRVYVNKDLFGLIRPVDNVYRDIPKLVEVQNNYDILMVTLPCFFSNTLSGQPQLVFSLDVLKIVLETEYIETKYPQFVEWVGEKIIPHFQILLSQDDESEEKILIVESNQKKRKRVGYDLFFKERGPEIKKNKVEKSSSKDREVMEAWFNLDETEKKIWEDKSLEKYKMKKEKKKEIENKLKIITKEIEEEMSEIPSNDEDEEKYEEIAKDFFFHYNKASELLEKINNFKNKKTKKDESDALEALKLLSSKK